MQVKHFFYMIRVLIIVQISMCFWIMSGFHAKLAETWFILPCIPGFLMHGERKNTGVGAIFTLVCSLKYFILARFKHV